MSLSVATVAETPLWQKAASQIRAQQDHERAFAERVRRDLLLYPGYFQAAVERLKELQAMHQGGQICLPRVGCRRFCSCWKRLKTTRK